MYGPYLIHPNVDIDDEEYIYEFLIGNVKYKFNVGVKMIVSWNVDNFTEAILTLEGLI